MRMQKITQYELMSMFLIIACVIGPAFHIGIEQLQIFRIGIGILFVYVLALLKHAHIQFDLIDKLTFFFFFFYFVYTLAISIFSPYGIQLNSTINFTIIFVLVTILLLLLNYNSILFVESLKKAILFLFYIMVMVSLWEITTHHHLSVATFFENVPEYIQFQSSTFYTNPNDYMAMFTLMFIWFVGYEKIIRKKIGLFTYIFFLVVSLLSFIDNSRLVMIVLFMTAIITFVNKKNLPKLLLIGVLVVAIAIYSIDWNSPDIKYLLEGLTFGGSSTGIRETLYKWALLSIEQNYGLGFGIDNSSHYYQNIYDPNLGGIINPHNYLLEILINSGVLMVVLYIMLNMIYAYLFLKRKMYFLVYMLIVYQLILISSSSSIFLWFHYVYFIGVLSLFYSNQIQTIKGYNT